MGEMYKNLKSTIKSKSLLLVIFCWFPIEKSITYMEDEKFTQKYRRRH